MFSEILFWIRVFHRILGAQAQVKEQVKFSRVKNFFWNFEIRKNFKNFFSEINSKILRIREILRR